MSIYKIILSPSLILKLIMISSTIASSDLTFCELCEWISQIHWKMPPVAGNSYANMVFQNGISPTAASSFGDISIQNFNSDLIIPPNSNSIFTAKLNTINILLRIFQPEYATSVEQFIERFHSKEKMAENLDNFRVQMSFICWEESKLGTNFTKNFNEICKISKISMDEQLYLISMNACLKRENELLEVYNIFEKVFVEPVKFTGGQSFSLGIQELMRLGRRRSDLKGSEIKMVRQIGNITSVFQEPDRLMSTTTYVITDEDGKVSIGGGTYVDVARDLEYLMNFRGIVIPGQGWPFEGTGPNGMKVLTGMGQQVLNGEADISISKNSFFEFRLAKLTFLPAITVTKTAVFYHEPPLYARNILILPFASEVWFSLFALWTTFFICILVLNHLSTENQYFHWFKVVHVICCQGLQYFPKKLPHQVFVLTTFLSSFMIYSYYAASFVARMSEPEPFIKKFQDLQRFNFQVFTNVQYYQYIQDFIDMNDTTSFAKIKNKSEELYSSSQEAILKVIPRTADRFAYIDSEDGFLSSAVQNNVSKFQVCSLSILRKTHRTTTKDGMFMKKGTPFKEVFGYRTLFLIERGMVEHHSLRDYYEENNLRKCRMRKGTMRLGLLHCAFAYKILMAGIVISFLIILLEIMTFFRKTVF